MIFMDDENVLSLVDVQLANIWTKELKVTWVDSQEMLIMI